MQLFISFGHLHIPIYGLFAAIGLVCAMVLLLRTARVARIDPDAMWDVGMVTVVGAFVLSRALLVLENLRIFLQYPILVLELPSLNDRGQVMTLLLAALYVRYRRISLPRALDAALPCAALTQVFLSLGRLVEGTREGMPTTLPWATSSAFGRVHPVEAYAAIAWALLCGFLLWFLQRSRGQGETAAWGLILAGLLRYFMAFWRLPQILYGTNVIDKGQKYSLVPVVAGGLLLAWYVASGARASRETVSERAKGVGDAV